MTTTSKKTDRSRLSGDYRVRVLKNGIRIRFEDRGQAINQFYASEKIDTPEKLLHVVLGVAAHVWANRSLLHSFIRAAMWDFTKNNLSDKEQSNE